jgi:putative IMPACT (imprinted ancient) family translation regulator
MQEALKEIQEVTKDTGLEVCLETSYPDLEKMKYYLKQNNIDIVNTEFSENVNVYVDITEEKYKKLLETKNDLNFKIISEKIIKEKYIVIEN